MLAQHIRADLRIINYRRKTSTQLDLYPGSHTTPEPWLQDVINGTSKRATGEGPLQWAWRKRRARSHHHAPVAFCAGFALDSERFKLAEHTRADLRIMNNRRKTITQLDLCPGNHTTPDPWLHHNINGTYKGATGEGPLQLGRRKRKARSHHHAPVAFCAGWSNLFN